MPDSSTIEEAIAAAERCASSDAADREPRLLEACARALGEAAGGGDALQVAVLRLVDGGEFTFAWPRELQAGNRFPAVPSLAGRALRDGALIENAVPKRPHFALYERIPRAGAPTAPIQRMLALPIPSTAGPIGVVEISRFGETPESAGPGFDTADGERVSGVLERLAPLLERAWHEEG